jgi:DNA-binding PadR family transcriptional regulator
LSTKKESKDEDNDQLIEFKGFLSFFILHELNKKSLCGDELALMIGNRKKDKLTPGTIYPTLKRLRKLKLLKYKKDGRKKNYFLTDLGKQELEKMYKVLKHYFKGIKAKL